MPRCAVSGGTQNTTQPIPPRASITIVVRKEDLSPLFDASMCDSIRCNKNLSSTTPDSRYWLSRAERPDPLPQRGSMFVGTPGPISVLSFSPTPLMAFAFLLFRVRAPRPSGVRLRRTRAPRPDCVTASGNPAPADSGARIPAAGEPLPPQVRALLLPSDP